LNKELDEKGEKS